MLSVAGNQIKNSYMYVLEYNFMGTADLKM